MQQRFIIIINLLFITLACNAETWNGVIKSNSQIYCCHGRVALSKAYNYYQVMQHLYASLTPPDLEELRAVPFFFFVITLEPRVG